MSKDSKKKDEFDEGKQNCYKPKLFIRTKEGDKPLSQEGKETEAVYEEILKYSITPTTLKSRSFFRDIDDEIFTEVYEYGKNKVERFGLNINSLKLLKFVEDYNREDKEKLESLASVSSAKDTSKAIKDIEIHKSSSRKILTEYEKHATEKAIKQLDSTKAITAIVDIFERDAEKKIVIENKLPKTHTVVLYKTSENYLVIDPSNAVFSTILAGAHKDIRVHTGSKFQMYKPKEPVNLNGWRDCIDISVKLAFSLTTNTNLGFETLGTKKLSEDTGYIELDSLKKSTSIREITNNKVEIYKNLHVEVQTSAVRMKQSSDISDSKKATVLLTTLESVLSILGSYAEKLKEKKYAIFV